MILAGTLFAAGCGEDPPAAPDLPASHAYELETIRQGDCCYDGNEPEGSEARLLMVRDDGEWTELWNRLRACDWPGPPAAPEVDFDEHMVVTVVDRVELYASRLRIDSVRQEGEDLVVRATREIGDGWPVLSQPHHAVLVRRAPARHEELRLEDE
jgi:hypothetical protein